MDARQAKQYRRALDFAEMQIKAARRALKERNDQDLHVAEEDARSFIKTAQLIRYGNVQMLESMEHTC
jgi:hypothetical protein